MKKFYISFVVAARNDNYGGNFLLRIQLFIDTLLYLLKKYNLSAEIIIVEWNPPLNKKRLREVLVLPKFLKFGDIRFIEVPNKFHKKFPNSNKMPIFEYIAKNVGIRRAKGEYVIATNADIIFSEELIKYLAKKELSPNCFYRVNRYDIKKLIPLYVSTEEKLKFCEDNWVMVHNFKGAFKRNWSLFDLFDYRWLYCYLLSFILRLRAILNNNDNSKFKIHSQASGDFFLMARSHWNELLGYPELKTHAFIDGYMCFIAASFGLSQIILNNKKIYHQEHERSEGSKRPLTDYQLYLTQTKQMMIKKQPLIFNDENWGLGNLNLKEYYL